MDLRLHNGTHRGYRSLRLRVTVHGPAGETRSAGLPVGALRDDQARTVSARLDRVTFPVEDVTLELVYAVP